MAQAPPQPAAAGGGAANPPQPPLPVPARTPALFAAIFADASRDPTGGDPSLLLGPFVHDLNNGGNNTATAQLRDALVHTGNERQLIATTIMSGGQARAYVCPFRWDDGLVHQNPTLANKYFAIEGELVGDHGHTVEIDRGVFDLLHNQVAVPSTATILAAYAADATTTQMGPYTAQDAGTEIVKTRRIVPIPHSLVGAWLSEADGVDAPRFWRVYYPLIAAAGHELECEAIIEFFQVAVTIPPNGAAGDPSLLDTARPAPPPRNPVLLRRIQGLLEHHFVQLRRDAATQQTNQIATAVGALAQQNRRQYEEAKLEKEAAKAATVEKMLGVDNLRRLLIMTRVPNETQLTMLCPFYKKLAEVPKSQRLGVLESSIQAAMEARGHLYLTFPTSAGMLSNLLGLQWHRTNDDSLATGLLGNPFLFGDSDEEYQQSVNLQVAMMESGGAAMSSADAAALLKIEVNLPGENESANNLRRMDALCSILLPAAHPFRTFIENHATPFESYMPRWKRLEMSHPLFQPAKGVFHLQYLALRVSRYWQEQSTTVTAVALPPHDELFREVDYKRPWEPAMSSTLRTKLKLDILSQLGGGGGSIPGLDFSADGSTISGLTNPATGERTHALGAPPGGGGGTRGSGGGSEGTNPHYNEVLFGEYRRRQVNGKPVRSRDLRLKISANELPELPLSIYCTSTPMCPAWHIKGMCNSSCPRAGDHKEYSAEQYAPLVEWCDKNYPS